MDILLLDMFVHGRGWIPSVELPNNDISSPILIEYNEDIYRVDNPSILRWVSSDVHVPEYIFDDIIGESPDRLPTATMDTEGHLKLFDNVSPTCSPSRDRVLDLVTTSILLNYIGVYDLAWELQGDIYMLREYLPQHWQNIGGITLNHEDEKLRKWDGTPTPYMKSQFNGMYVPYGLSEMSSPRYLLYENILHYSEMYHIQLSSNIQYLSFGIIPDKVDISSDLLSAISIVGVGRDITAYTPCPKKNMSISEIVSLLQGNTSLTSSILDTVPLDIVKTVADELIERISIASIIDTWDICTFASESKKCSRIPEQLLRLIENDDRVDIMEDMCEGDLSSIGSSLEIPIPYEDGDISISQLITSIQEKLSNLLKE